jgi:hypothetical protein
MAKKAPDGGIPPDLIKPFLKTMIGESDRGCVLVGLSEIDIGLGKLLECYLSKRGAETDAMWLLDQLPGNRPLANLAIRTRMARCLGLINDEIRGVIDALRKLRNTHAHGILSVELTEKVTKKVLDKWTAHRPVVDNMCGYQLARLTGSAENHGIARKQLIACTSAVSFMLALNLMDLQKGRPVKFGAGLIGETESHESSVSGQDGPQVD